MNGIPPRFPRHDPRTLALSSRFLKLVAKGERLASFLARPKVARHARRSLEWRLAVVEAELALARMALRELVEALEIEKRRWKTRRSLGAVEPVRTRAGQSHGFHVSPRELRRPRAAALAAGAGA